MRPAGLLLLLAGCDRVFGLFPLVSYDEPLDATRIDAPPPSACPVSYSLTIPSSTSRYRLELGKTDTWAKAANSCASETKTAGSFTHLVVLSNELEREQLTSAVALPSNGQVWIGFADYLANNQWEWVTAEDTGGYPFPLSPSSPPWEGDDPDRTVAAGCVTIRDGGLIGDKPCIDVYGWLCECDGYLDTGRR